MIKERVKMKLTLMSSIWIFSRATRILEFLFSRKGPFFKDELRYGDRIDVIYNVLFD